MYLINALKDTLFDVVVIGGGSTGSMIALDATLRGYKVALVERGDFASGTSSRSTNLLHGGVRYLENAVKHADCVEFKLEALHERKYMLANAPYLTNPIATILPITSWIQAHYMRIGFMLYDLIAWNGGLPKSHIIKQKEMQYLFPKLYYNWINGGLVYYDGQSNDARLDIAINRTAIDHGAISLNYMEVTDLLHKTNQLHEEITGVHIHDRLSNEDMDIHAKIVVNAAGPFVDSIMNMYESVRFPNRKEPHQNVIVPSKGVHLIVRGRHCPTTAGIVTATTDKRIMFMLPWQNYTIIGTTDTPCELEEYPEATEEDIDFIINEMKHLMTTPIKKSDILSVWCGIRPLVRVPDTSTNKTARISRTHEIWSNNDGFLTIAGGKWTTVRNMAEDVCDVIGRTTQLPMKQCITKSFPYYGANEKHNLFPDTHFLHQQLEVQEDLEDHYHLPADIAEHLSRFYGYRAYQIADMAVKENSKRLHNQLPYLQVEVNYCIHEEMAVRLADIVLRRLRIGVMDTKRSIECIPLILQLMQKEYNWDRTKCIQEIEDTVMQLNKYSIIKYDSTDIINQLNDSYICYNKLYAT